MDRDKVHDFLKLLGIGFPKIRDLQLWVKAPCPFAPYLHENKEDTHPSFGISLGEKSNYNCFACGRKGNLKFLPTALSYYTKIDRQDLREFIAQHEGIFTGKAIERKLVEPMHPRILERFLPLTGYPVMGVSQQSGKEWGLVYDDIEHRMIFPIYRADGQLVGIRGRYLGPSISGLDIIKTRSYTELNPSGDAKASGIWYGEHFPLVFNKHLVVVEGERDAILLRQAGIKNVWAAMGASVSDPQLDSLRKIKVPVLLFYDDDKGGEMAKGKTAKAIRGLTKMYHITNYCGVNDPAEAVEKGLVVNVLQSATVYV